MSKSRGGNISGSDGESGDSWLDRPDEEVARLAQDEAAFEVEVKRLAARHGRTRLEIGRLIHAYKSEHGHQYGDGLFQRVADKAGIALKSARNYHRLYRLTVEGKDSANLPNLPLSAQFELARLLDKPDGMESILRIADEAVTNGYTVAQVAQAVRDHKNWGKKPDPKPRPDPDPKPHPNPAKTYSEEDEAALSKASNVLERCAGADFDPANIPHAAEHRQRLHQIGVNLLDHIANIVEKNPSDLDNLAPTIESIRARCDIILAQGRKMEAA